jgi:nucleoside-diphosphate-sugar epimerase
VKKVLVTGASGFIGLHSLPLLAERGFEVHALARHRPKGRARRGVTWHACDLLSPGARGKIIGSVRPDYLLLFAWHAVPGEYWMAPDNVEWVRANVELVTAFASAGGKRAVLCGSCAEYQRDAGCCKEDATAMQPDTLYGQCKYEAETKLAALGRQTGLSFACGRLFFLYGPHEHASRVVPYVVQNLLKGEPALCSSGQQMLDFSYVKDVASAFVALVESDVQGGVNIASGRPVTLSTVLQEIGRQTGRPELIRLGAVPDGSGFRNLWADTTRLAAEVRWQPAYSLSQGIAETIEWWRSCARQA